jgi:hypothetical protein
MLLPKGSRDVYVERNATAVLAILALSSFMALTAVLMILNYDQTPDVPATPGCSDAIACSFSNSARSMPSN